MGSEPRRATQWASMEVEALDLTVRAYNCLRQAGITSVGELVKKTPNELLSIRAMGRTTVRVIQDALGAQGLHLGMQDVDLGACQAIDGFLEAMDLVRGGGITCVADVVSKTPREVAALPGVDGAAVRHIEDGLAKWGLSLDTWSAPEPTSGERSLQHGDSQSVRDELLHVLKHVLADRESSWFRCFAAYHGIEGRGKRTLQDIGDRGPEYGFGAPVTRERVRQVLAKAEEVLRRRAIHIVLAQWARAVVAVQERVPARVGQVVDAFGYRSCDDPGDVYSMLGLVASIFSLEFPFDLQTIRGIDVVTGRTGACVVTVDVVHRLTRTENDSYFDTAATAKALGCEEAVLENAVGGPFGWEFLDEAHRYFWAPPRLPPRNHAVTGNAVLTGLCKVFSVAREAAIVDLAQAVARHRGVRKAVPRDVVEGIATRSGLFDLEEGVLKKKAGQAWFCLGERDLDLLRVCVEHGRVVSSRTLQSSLVRCGLSSENAAATIAYSPLLVHAKAGMFLDEGVYKLVCSTGDVVMALGESGREGNRRTGEPGPHTEGAEAVLRIAVSSRVRLSGSHFAPEPLGMDGEWRVRDADGTVIGAVTLRGPLVKGLCSVVDSLGLETNAVLELRRRGDDDLLAVGA